MSLRFKLWVETEGEKPLLVIDTDKLSYDDRRMGNAAIAEDGYIVGYHVTDDPEGMMAMTKGSKKLTATYGKGKSRTSELGPGLYISAVPQMWMGRSTDKWGFLEKLTPQQKEALAHKIRNDTTLAGQKFKDNNGNDKVFHHVSSFERERAFRDIDIWLNTGNNPVLVNLANQPYNIKFWEPAYLKPLGIEPGKKPSVLKVTCVGKFVNMDRHIHDFPMIAKMIRAGYDGGFVPGGWSGNPELCIWRKEAIRDISLESSF